MRRTRALPLLALTAIAVLLALLALAGPGHAAAGLEHPALLEDRGPIRIDDDAGFTAENGVRGGNGTAEDPFLIAHWRINSTTQHVRIANTTKAFVLRNVDLAGQCTVGDNASACVYEAGLYLENVAGGSVLHSRFRDMDRSAIEMLRVRGVEVVENEFLGGAAGNQGTGVKVLQAQDVQVRGNVFRNQGPTGAKYITAALRVWDSNDTLVQGNDLRGATEVALNLINARRTLVEDNTFSGNEIAIAAQGRDAVVWYNSISESRFLGILLTGGWLHLERNDLTFNPGGIQVVGPTTNATMRLNNVMGASAFGASLVQGAQLDAGENYWDHPTGPNVNFTGPGSGTLILLNRTAPENVQVRPPLAERVLPVGAFAPRSGRTIVTGAPGTGGPGGGGPGGPADPAPVAVFEGPGEAFTGQEASFSGARSFDPEGGALRYAWDFGDGATAAGLRARHAWTAPGAYVVRLTVTDPTGLSGLASSEVLVTRQPFTVGIAINETAFRNEAVEVRAIVSGAPGAAVYRFTTAGPGTFAGDPSPLNRSTLRLEEPREYIVGVEARSGNETRTAFERVLVVNRPPTVRITVEPEAPTADHEVTLRAAATDPDGDALAYTWDFGAGQPGASGPNVTRRFGAGLVVVSLTVSDGAASAADQRAITVLPGAGAPEPGKPAPGPAVASLLALLAGLALARRGRRR